MRRVPVMLLCLYFVLPASLRAQVTDDEITAFVARTDTSTVWEEVCAVEAKDLFDVAFSPGQQFVATATKDGVCQVWDVKTAKKLGDFSSEGGSDCIAVSPDGKYAAVGGRFESLRVWEVATGKLAHDHKSMKTPLLKLTFSNDGEFIYTSDAKGVVGRVPTLGGEPILHGFKTKQSLAGWHVLQQGTKVLVGQANTSVLLDLDKPNSKKMKIVNFGVPGVERVAAGTRLMASVTKTDRVHRDIMNEDLSARVSTVNYPHRLAVVDAMAVDPNDRFVLLVRKDGAVELKPTTGISIWKQRLPLFIRARKIVIGDDALTACSIDGYGFKVWSLPRFPLQWFVDRDLLLKKLLASRDYKKVDRLMQGLLAARKTSVTDAVTMLQSEYSNGKPWDERANLLEEWCDKDPSAALPRLALSEAYIDRAWKERGTGYANTVTKEQWALFEQYLGDAQTRLEECPLEKDTAEMVLTSRARLAVTLSATREEAEELYKLIMEHVPESPDAHGELVRYYQTRWHGEPGECAEYIANAADDVGGKEGEKLYALIAARLRPYYSTPTFFARTKLDPDRLIAAADKGIEDATTKYNKHFWIMQKLTWTRRTGDKKTTGEALGVVMATRANQTFASSKSLTGEYRRAIAWLQSKPDKDGKTLLALPLPKNLEKIKRLKPVEKGGAADKKKD